VTEDPAWTSSGDPQGLSAAHIADGSYVQMYAVSRPRRIARFVARNPWPTPVLTNIAGQPNNSPGWTITESWNDVHGASLPPQYQSDGFTYSSTNNWFPQDSTCSGAVPVVPCESTLQVVHLLGDATQQYSCLAAPSAPGARVT